MQTRERERDRERERESEREREREKESAHHRAEREDTKPNTLESGGSRTRRRGAE
jgi:epidermal growth factor receptor kinase substrate 8